MVRGSWPSTGELMQGDLRALKSAVHRSPSTKASPSYASVVQSHTSPPLTKCSQSSSGVKQQKKLKPYITLQRSRSVITVFLPHPSCRVVLPPRRRHHHR